MSTEAAKESMTSTKRTKDPYLKKHSKFVCLACSPTLKSSSRRQLIQSAKESQLLAVCECIKNVVCMTCPVDAKVKKTLLRLSQPKVPSDERRKLLTQKGAGVFLPLVASAVLTYLLK